MSTRQSLSGLNGEPILRPNERGVLAAFFTLSGCGGFDEAGERLKCEKSNSDQPKVEECLKKARQDYHEQVEAAKSQAKNR
jgi:hypothetical protein